MFYFYYDFWIEGMITLGALDMHTSWKGMDMALA